MSQNQKKTKVADIIGNYDAIDRKKQEEEERDQQIRGKKMSPRENKVVMKILFKYVTVELVTQKTKKEEKLSVIDG